MCWITLHNPSAPVNAYDSLIANLNELSDKFGYSLKTYNILGTVLMIKGETEKAKQIFHAALSENNVFEMGDGDSNLHPSNHDLASIIYNYIKCNMILNLHVSAVSDSYRIGGQTVFLSTDELNIKLFALLNKMQSPLKTQFDDER